MSTAAVEAPISVVLIDDHTVVRTALQLLLNAQPHLRVAGVAAHSAEALDVVRRTQPDVILLDLDLGDERGADLLPDLRACAPGARVLVLTGLRSTEAYQQAVSGGALGVVLKEQAVDTLVLAIERVHAGHAWLDPALVARVLATPAGLRERAVNSAEGARTASLTERERAVIVLLCEGLKNKQIAERLAISDVTVGHHLTSVFAKLGVSTRLELMTFAYRSGLAEPPRSSG